MNQIEDVECCVPYPQFVRIDCLRSLCDPYSIADMNHLLENLIVHLDPLIEADKLSLYKKILISENDATRLKVYINSIQKLSYYVEFLSNPTFLIRKS
jgi:hypothetical protein